MIYIIYKDGVMLYPTTLPRVALDAFKNGCDRVELWRNEKLVRSTASAKELNRIVNPPANEENDGGGGDVYEW